MRVKYDWDKDVCSELSVSNHAAGVLNELDYLNQDCVVYRVEADIYLENSNEARLLYVETAKDASGADRTENDSQKDFQTRVFTLKLEHYKNALSWMRYEDKTGNNIEVGEHSRLADGVYMSKTCSGVRIEDAGGFYKG